MTSIPYLQRKFFFGFLTHLFRATDDCSANYRIRIKRIDFHIGRHKLELKKEYYIVIKSLDNDNYWQAIKGASMNLIISVSGLVHENLHQSFCQMAVQVLAALIFFQNMTQHISCRHDSYALTPLQFH